MQATAVKAVIAHTNPQCHANTCSDSGCALSLSGVPTPNVLISMEHPASPVPTGQSHCDYLFVGGDDDVDGGPWVVPIELTTGKKRASELLAQIRSVTRIADDLLPQKIVCRFDPVAAHRRGLHREDMADLRKPANRISFRGQRRNVRLANCGDQLVGALTD